MLHTPPNTPIDDLLDDINEWIESFPNGITLRYDKDIPIFECIYDVKNKRSTFANDPITALEMAFNFICPECRSVNTEDGSISWDMGTVDEFKCHDCNYIHTDI